MASINLNDSISADSCIDSANHLIELCELPFSRISSLQDINSSFFISLYECITGHTIPDLLLSEDSTTEVHNIQAVIDTLSYDILGLSLSHITGEDIVAGNTVAISNLLEVLEGICLYLFPQKETGLKRTNGISADNTDSLNLQNKILQSSKKLLVSSSDENTYPVLKRKLCRKTLRKSGKVKELHDRKAPKPSSHDHTEESSSKLENKIFKNRSKSPVKRKNSKPVSGVVKRPHIENIEQLYDINFEKKVRALLLSDKSPTIRSHQLKKNYIKSLKSPLKKKTIPACKKSFLLPYNLRPKSPVQKQPLKNKNCLKKKFIEPSVSEKDENLQRDGDKPAFIQSILEEFPGFKFPKNTLSLLKKCYYHHVGQMHKQLKDTLLKKPTTLIQLEKAMEDQSKLSRVLEKDILEKNHLRSIKEQKMVENRIKGSLREAKFESVKMRQYFEEFQKSMSKKLGKRNFSEELLIEKTFKEILDIQKKKVLQLCKHVRETNEQDAKQHKVYLQALKNLYKEQLSLLAESIDEEQKDTLVRKIAQKLAAEKMNQGIRKKLQSEVHSLQKDVLEMIEDIHFRELDAQNFIIHFQQQNS